MAADPNHIDPAAYLEELLTQASPDLMRKMLTDTQVAQTKLWVADGAPEAEVARRLGIGRATLYKYLTGSTG
jgi:DNA-binding phage protein